MNEAVKPPVFLQHGIMDSSDAFLTNQVDGAPAFTVADAGYDVWLGNLRGNKHSNRHVSLDYHDDEEQFFDFDQQTHATVDLVTMINYVKSTTGYEKVAYVGHSMGTTIMFKLAAV